MITKTNVFKKINSFVILVLMIILIPSIVTAEPLYRAENQIIGHDGRGNRLILEGNEFIGTICETSPPFYTVNYQNGQVFVEKNQLTTIENPHGNLVDNRQYFTGEEVVIGSTNIFIHPGNYAPDEEYLVPIYWGKKGEAGLRVQNALENLVVTGDFHHDLESVLTAIINMNITYGGDLYKQIESIENGSTMCCGATWLVANFLDKTTIEYRFVLQHDVEDPTHYDYKNAGHIYLEVLTPNGWHILEPCELLTTASGRTPSLDYVLWTVINTKAREQTFIDESHEAHNYQVLIKSVGFQQGQVTTPTAEKVVLNNY